MPHDHSCRSGSSARTRIPQAFTLKPRPDMGGYGWQQLGIEIYGAPLLNSWLDRELGLAGRLVLTDGSTQLVRTERSCGYLSWPSILIAA